MRATFLKISVLSISMLATTSLLAAGTPINKSDSNTKVIDGSYNAMHFKTPYNGKYYIQAATFKFAKNAHNYQHQLSTQIKHPIHIETRGTYYLVIIGPIQTAAEVRALGNTISDSPPPLVKVEPISTSNSIGDLDPAANHFELIGALGVGDLMPGSGLLGVTSNETDFLVQPNGNNWRIFAAQAGVGYVHYFPGALQYSENLQWFPSIEPELNAYYLGQGNFTGDVWQFSSPAFNDLTYNTSIQSTRLMVDGALTIASRKQYSLYAKGGIGNAWNQLRYHDAANTFSASCPDQGLNLGSHTNSNFAWEAGGGVTYAFNHRVLLSLEYLYADLGTAKTSASGNTGTITNPVIIPANFNLNSQAVLLGLHVAL